MKIAIVAPSPVPFLIGGAEKFFWGLHRAINQYTLHEAELIKVPSRDQEFWPLMEAYRRFSRLDLSHFDMLITTKYPAWMVSHQNHHIYMQHTCRGVYDLYNLNRDMEVSHPQIETLCKMLNDPNPMPSMFESFFSELFRLRDIEGLERDILKFPGPFTRAVIRWLDQTALKPGVIKTYSAISQNVANREGYFPKGIDINILHHPTDLEGLHSSSYDYIFTASRLEELKRLDLLIKAFMLVKADIEFRIAGTGGQEGKLRRLASGDDRIRFLGFIQDDEMVRQYAGALFVPFIPYDEDYGLITVEAMQSSKAVLTTTDSGGVKELVIHGINGMVVTPDIESLAAAMQELILNKERTIKMGRNAKETASHINWRNTVERLLGHIEGNAKQRSQNVTKRKKIVVVNHFSVYPSISGGQKRIYHLYKELAQGFDIVLLTLANSTSEARHISISPGLTENVVPMSEVQDKVDMAFERQLGASVRDISAIENYQFSPSFINALSQECASADIVISSHPYLYYAIRKAYSGRLYYDAHNVEYDMKSVILPDSEHRNRYLELVKKVEEECCRDAELIFSVSESDKTRFTEIYGINKDKVVIVPNGMDFKVPQRVYLSKTEKEALKERLGIANSPTAVFVGSWHGPNIEGLQIIVDTASSLPECLFFIIGSVCQYSATMPENVKAFGILSEDEKEVVYNASDIALNPIKSGAGSNLKIMEYVAYMLPVITFKHGTRGYELDAEDCFIISGPGDFADTLKDALRPEKRPEIEAMAERAYKIASARYDWSAIAARLLEVIRT